jgi:hypothetical protein
MKSLPLKIGFSFLVTNSGGTTVGTFICLNVIIFESSTYPNRNDQFTQSMKYVDENAMLLFSFFPSFV